MNRWSWIIVLVSNLAFLALQGTCWFRLINGISGIGVYWKETASARGWPLPAVASITTEQPFASDVYEKRSHKWRISHSNLAVNAFVALSSIA